MARPPSASSDGRSATGAARGRPERRRSRDGGRYPAGGLRRGPHPGLGPVPDDPRHVGDERVDQIGGQRPRHHGLGHPDRHHPLHPRHGRLHDHRREDRRTHRPAPGVRHRPGRLRLRIAHHRPRAESHRAHHRMVGPRGARCRVDPAGHRGAGGRQLPDGAAVRRLRGHRRRGRHRRGGRTTDRGCGHHLRVVAVGVRRRGGHRPRHPRVTAQARRRGPRASGRVRCDRCRPLGGRPLADRLRRPQVRSLGMGQAQSPTGRRGWVCRPSSGWCSPGCW